jgi:drug/metabolite transporter (DMT)-like permease
MKLELEQPSALPSTAESTRAANLSSVALILVSVLLSSLGQLTFKAGLNDIGELKISVDILVKVITNPLMLLGFAIYGSSALLWMLALMKAELSFAYPFLSVTYVVILIGGALVLDEKVTWLRLVSVVLFIGGLLVIARSDKS